MKVRVITRGLATVPAPPLLVSMTDLVGAPQLSVAVASLAFAPGTSLSCGYVAFAGTLVIVGTVLSLTVTS